jgi:hypothetical protein
MGPGGEGWAARKWSRAGMLVGKCSGCKGAGGREGQASLCHGRRRAGRRRLGDVARVTDASCMECACGADAGAIWRSIKRREKWGEVSGAVAWVRRHGHLIRRAIKGHCCPRRCAAVGDQRSPGVCGRRTGLRPGAGPSGAAMRAKAQCIDALRAIRANGLRVRDAQGNLPAEAKKASRKSQKG